MLFLVHEYLLERLQKNSFYIFYRLRETMPIFVSKLFYKIMPIYYFANLLAQKFKINYYWAMHLTEVLFAVCL